MNEGAGELRDAADKAIAEERAQCGRELEAKDRTMQTLQAAKASAEATAQETISQLQDSLSQLESSFKNCDWMFCAAELSKCHYLMTLNMDGSMHYGFPSWAQMLEEANTDVSGYYSRFKSDQANRETVEQVRQNNLDRFHIESYCNEWLDSRGVKRQPEDDSDGLRFNEVGLKLAPLEPVAEHDPMRGHGPTGETRPMEELDEFDNNLLGLLHNELGLTG
ncbi:uncharacterized protein KY384_002561 [Bacidia gigantensis]|uniref:uncharacterized protein n=1 Tax=Bacidia gigantensis TaxID=2732470 RepID=UPI001D055796|nr:uncharacterized protein KY384_002561 [Bacidia gigantensis]KAG8532684.1 hypothetical protein KY384_002561 [Bacidia gigantensis]